MLHMRGGLLDMLQVGELEHAHLTQVRIHVGGCFEPLHDQLRNVLLGQLVDYLFGANFIPDAGKGNYGL